MVVALNVQAAHKSEGLEAPKFKVYLILAIIIENILHYFQCPRYLLVP